MTIRQWLCGLRGHDTHLKLETAKLSLHCVTCGHETAGWKLNETPPTVTVPGDRQRHALKRPRLVTRRIA